MNAKSQDRSFPQLFIAVVSVNFMEGGRLCCSKSSFPASNLPGGAGLGRCLNRSYILTIDRKSFEQL
jgi:hypothetical protein